VLAGKPAISSVEQYFASIWIIFCPDCDKSLRSRALLTHSISNRKFFLLFFHNSHGTPELTDCGILAGED
jgi:hypothetical protein